MKRAAHQVWLFTTSPDVPPNEQRIRGRDPRIEAGPESLRLLAHPGHLQRHCRIRSYLVSARNHGRRLLHAVRDALNTTAWMPPRKTTPAFALAA